MSARLPLPRSTTSKTPLPAIVHFSPVCVEYVTPPGTIAVAFAGSP
jgi:hypothetical protein